MDLLKIVLHSNILLLISFLLILCFITLSLYGLWLCCSSKKTNLYTEEKIFSKQDYTWKSLLHSPLKDPVAPLNDQHDTHERRFQSFRGFSKPPHSSRTLSRWMCVKFLHNYCVNERPIQTSNNSYISCLRDQFLKFQWTNRWFPEQKENCHTSPGNEDSKNLEESSLDCLINRLDSLILSFHSSDASPSIDDESGSISDDSSTVVLSLNAAYIDALEPHIIQHDSKNNESLSYPLASHMCMQGVQVSEESKNNIL